MEPETKKALIAKLSSPDEEQRRLAMEALKDGLSEGDLQWLIRPLSDESWRVRKEGIEGLSLLSPTPQLIAALVPLMDPGKELTLRNSVVEVLERLGAEAANMLVPYLNIDQNDVRKFLVDILGNIAHPDTVPALLELLNDPEDNIRAAAAEALAAIGDNSVCETLLRAMEGANEWFIYSLIGTLARLRCSKALPVFFDYLGNQLLSKPALSGIGAMGGLEDGLRLMGMAGSLSRGAAKAALIACGSIYRRHAMDQGVASCSRLTQAVLGVIDGDVLKALVSQVEVADDPDDRSDILAVLGMSGAKLSLDAVLRFVEDDALTRDVDLALWTLGSANPGIITDLLEHHDPLVRQRAVRTLEKMGSADSVLKLYELLKDESGHVRKDAAAAVSSLGDGESIEKLIPVLEDEYSDVARSAAQAIVHLGRKCPGDLAALIAPMLQNSGPALYTLLITILMEVQAPGWEELCLKAAQSTEPEVRAAAVSCLRRSSQRSAAATIINSLADENAHVRGQAVVALEELKDPEAIAPLKAALYDQDPWVRSAAVSALSMQPEAEPGDFSELLSGEDLMMQTNVLDALGRMAAEGNRNALWMLIEAFEQDSPEIRRSICRLLGKVEDHAALDLLVRALDDNDPGIRVFAVHALSQRKEHVIRDLLSKVGEKDPDKAVREAVRSVLEGFK
ncbi:MAG: HEAT repeat domain-containing protein [Pseudomonadota bacterium]|jgi:HEAT repeat protein